MFTYSFNCFASILGHVRGLSVSLKFQISSTSVTVNRKKCKYLDIGNLLSVIVSEIFSEIIFLFVSDLLEGRLCIFVEAFGWLGKMTLYKIVSKPIILLAFFFTRVVFTNEVDGEELFYKPTCHSDTYEIILKKFSSIWILVNTFILLCSFSLFLKYWCFKTLAKETVKGY